MKPNLDDSSENDLDLLLFRYVEGELDTAQVRQVERRMAADAALRDEVALWKQAFVQEDFCDTSQLEKNLLVGEEVFWPRHRLGTFLLVMLLAASLFRFLPTTKKAPIRTLDSASGLRGGTQPVPTWTYKASKPETQNPVPASRKPPQQSKTLALPKPRFFESGKPGELPAESVAFAPLEMKTIGFQSFGDSVEWPEVKYELKHKVALTKKMSRQQRRQTMRLKENALQQRKANEFLKGNTPYTVPLNTDNF